MRIEKQQLEGRSSGRWIYARVIVHAVLAYTRHNLGRDGSPVLRNCLICLPGRAAIGCGVYMNDEYQERIKRDPTELSTVRKRHAPHEESARLAATYSVCEWQAVPGLEGS
jgi:hypothetical protein